MRRPPQRSSGGYLSLCLALALLDCLLDWVWFVSLFFSITSASTTKNINTIGKKQVATQNGIQDEQVITERCVRPTTVFPNTKEFLDPSAFLNNTHCWLSVFELGRDATYFGMISWVQSASKFRVNLKPTEKCLARRITEFL